MHCILELHILPWPVRSPKITQMCLFSIYSQEVKAKPQMNSRLPAETYDHLHLDSYLVLKNIASL